MNHIIKYFAGIDVQINRGCCYYILDANKKYIASGWEKENIPQSFKNNLLELTNNQLDSIAVGIDAPRMPLTKLRTRYFDKKKKEWNIKSELSNGRECEVIIKSYNIANPQWTKPLRESPDWMKLGFEIFSALKDFPFVYEVFPSASYKMLRDKNLKYELSLNSFGSGVKDMMDASVAAITVYEFVNGRGCEVGGEDGLGTIVLPGKVFN
jgi:predicted nuclease with RNAse H fold